MAGGRGVPLKRTPKLLAGIGRCEFVVDVEWLYQSAKEGRVLNGIEYVLCDSEVWSRTHVDNIVRQYFEEDCRCPVEGDG